MSELLFWISKVVMSKQLYRHPKKSQPRVAARTLAFSKRTADSSRFGSTEMRQYIGGRLNEILDSVVQKAVAGSYQHAKLLLELAAVYPPVAIDAPSSKNLVAHLLERMGLQYSPDVSTVPRHGANGTLK